jgi:hypothetical protein
MGARRVAGRYTLQRAIGHGANGSVWLAHDEVLDRPVAVKRTGSLTDPDTAAARAEREARLAAQLSHPHVVAVFDLVTDDDAAWLVMEHVDGPPLSKVVQEAGPLSPDEAARALAPVADALVQAHQHGIVHRDVKPSNILVPGDGGTKLSDFGIARSTGDATLTRTGLVTGSPAYLAPEVAVGGAATPASDVWAVGATLVHVLTGRPPYHRDDADNAPLAVVLRIVNEDPPVVPEAGWLAPLLARTMARDPAERPSMAEVRDALRGRAWSAEQTVQLPAVPVQGGGRRPGARAAAAAVGAVAALAVIAALALQTNDQDTGGPTAGPQTSSTTPAAGPRAPSADEMEEFARDYVRTASTDPARGYAMLTPAYQDDSPRYAAFWGPMKHPEILDVSADPSAMTVTYTYRYQLSRGSRRTETVTLELVQEDGRLLIAGAV